VEAGRLFVESHASLRDDYEVSVPEVDTLAQALAGLRGSCGHGSRAEDSVDPSWR
jgi:galactokinase